MKVIAGGLAAVLTAAALAPWLVFRDDLPDRVATHWELGGEPNGSMTVLGATIMLTVIAAGFAALAALLLVRSPGGVWWPALLMAGVAGMVAALSCITAWVNRDVADWPQATLGAGWLGAAFGTGLGVTFATAGVTAGRWPPPQPPSSAAATTVEPTPVADGERIAWFGTAHSHGFAFAAVAEAVVGLVLLAIVPMGGLVLLFVAVVLAAFASVHVTVDSSGLRVRSGTIPWPPLTIPLDRMELVQVIDVRPTKWGGWGYRGSLKVFKQAAWVVRAGTGLKILTADNRTFVVTVDHADEAAAALEGLRRLRSTRR